MPHRPMSVFKVKGAHRRAPHARDSGDRHTLDVATRKSRPAALGSRRYRAGSVLGNAHLWGRRGGRRLGGRGVVAAAEEAFDVGEEVGGGGEFVGGGFAGELGDDGLVVLLEGGDGFA